MYTLPTSLPVIPRVRYAQVCQLDMQMFARSVPIVAPTQVGIRQPHVVPLQHRSDMPGQDGAWYERQRKPSRSVPSHVSLSMSEATPPRQYGALHYQAKKAPGPGV